MHRRHTEQRRSMVLRATLGAIVCASLLSACAEDGQKFPEGSMEMLYAQWPPAAPGTIAKQPLDPGAVSDVLDDSAFLEEYEQYEGKANDAEEESEGIALERLRAGERRVLRDSLAKLSKPPLDVPITPGAAPQTLTVLPPLAIDGFDPMIAVGEDSLVAVDAGRIGFLHKSGADAGQLLAPKGAVAKTLIGLNEFFAGLWVPFNLDGSPNTSSINRHMDLPEDPDFTCDPDTDVLTENADGTTTPIYGVCVNEFYDNKVVYDMATKRFVITSAARNRMWDSVDSLQNAAGCLPVDKGGSADTFERCQKFPRRYIALAVSKTSDPRDGFHQWIINDSNYSDGHVTAVANGYVLIAPNGPKPQPGVPDGEPLVYVIEMADLTQGKAKPRNSAYSRIHFGEAVSLRPAQQVGTGDGFAYVLARPHRDIHGSGKQVTQYVYALPKRTATSFPSWIEIKVDLTLPLGLPSHGLMAFAKGMLFHAHQHPATTQRAVRLPVQVKNGKPAISSAKADGFLDVVLAASADGTDVAGATAVGVNVDGDLGVVYPLETSSAHKVVVRLISRDAITFGQAMTLAEGVEEPPRADLASGAVDPANPQRIWFVHRVKTATGTQFVAGYVDS